MNERIRHSFPDQANAACRRVNVAEPVNYFDQVVTFDRVNAAITYASPRRDPHFGHCHEVMTHETALELFDCGRCRKLAKDRRQPSIAAGCQRLQDVRNRLAGEESQRFTVAQLSPRTHHCGSILAMKLSSIGGAAPAWRC